MATTSNAKTVADFGSILGIWAHPDDETFMVGGLLAMAAAGGQKVSCVTATHGEAGVATTAVKTVDGLGETRSHELHAALDILGVSNRHLLDYQDGHCTSVHDDEIVPQLVALIDTYKPDTVVTFPPDGVTGHADHRCVSKWAQLATTASTHKTKLYFAVHTQEAYDSFLRLLDEQLNIYFAIKQPVLIAESNCSLLLHLPPEFATKKAMALKAMPSQYAALFEFLGDKGVEAAFGTEALVSASVSDQFWPTAK